MQFAAKSLLMLACWLIVWFLLFVIFQPKTF